MMAVKAYDMTNAEPRTVANTEPRIPSMSESVSDSYLMLTMIRNRVCTIYDNLVGSCTSIIDPNNDRPECFGEAILRIHSLSEELENTLTRIEDVLGFKS